MSSRFLFWLALATFWAVPEVSVRAHDILVETAPPGYEDASSAGLRAFDAGRYLEAKNHFEEAHRLWPTARSLRALGHCEYELRNYAVAVQLLEQALASTVRPLSDTQRAESKELLQRARGYVANCRIRTVPVNSQVSIDGVAVPDGGAGIVLLPVGPHVVQVQAEGYQPRRREFEIVKCVESRALGRALGPCHLPMRPLQEARGSIRRCIGGGGSGPASAALLPRAS